jgi:hypothetical protein
MNILSTCEREALMTPHVERVTAMSRERTQPSRRLIAAAAAERAEIHKQRDALIARRGELHERIADVNAALADLDERAELIDRLAGVAETVSPKPRPDQDGARTDKIALSGPAIRRAAASVLLSDPRALRALHYRDWFALLEQHGYTVAGKDPVAVFLTQLSRSPVIQRGTQSGIYEIQLDAADRLRTQLANRQRELRALTSENASTSDLTSIRTQRTALTREIDKLEKAFVEAQSTLENAPGELAAAG